MSSQHYVNNAIKTVESELLKAGKTLLSNVKTPISCGYPPEFNATPLLGPERANYYQNLIEILRWAFELGCINIHIHASMLSSFLSNPREGHLEQVLHIFAYLNCYDCSTMVFDDTLPKIDLSSFPVADWTEFYRDAKEEIPINAPEPLGKEVHMYCCCNADHAGDHLTRRSQTGIIIFLNHAPILWYSKKQKHCRKFDFQIRICGTPNCCGSNCILMI